MLIIINYIIRCLIVSISHDVVVVTQNSMHNRAHHLTVILSLGRIPMRFVSISFYSYRTLRNCLRDKGAKLQ